MGRWDPGFTGAEDERRGSSKKTSPCSWPYKRHDVSKIYGVWILKGRRWKPFAQQCLAAHLSQTTSSIHLFFQWLGCRNLLRPLTVLRPVKDSRMKLFSKSCKNRANYLLNQARNCVHSHCLEVIIAVISANSHDLGVWMVGKSLR